MTRHLVIFIAAIASVKLSTNFADCQLVHPQSHLGRLVQTFASPIAATIANSVRLEQASLSSPQIENNDNPIYATTTSISSPTKNNHHFQDIENEDDNLYSAKLTSSSDIQFPSAANFASSQDDFRNLPSRPTNLHLSQASDRLPTTNNDNNNMQLAPSYQSVRGAISSSQLGHIQAQPNKKHQRVYYRDEEQSNNNAPKYVDRNQNQYLQRSANQNNQADNRDYKIGTYLGPGGFDDRELASAFQENSDADDPSDADDDQDPISHRGHKLASSASHAKPGSLSQAMPKYRDEVNVDEDEDDDEGGEVSPHNNRLNSMLGRQPRTGLRSSQSIDNMQRQAFPRQSREDSNAYNDENTNNSNNNYKNGEQQSAQNLMTAAAGVGTGINYGEHQAGANAYDLTSLMGAANGMQMYGNPNDNSAAMNQNFFNAQQNYQGYQPTRQANQRSKLSRSGLNNNGNDMMMNNNNPYYGGYGQQNGFNFNPMQQQMFNQQYQNQQQQQQQFSRQQQKNGNQDANNNDDNEVDNDEDK